MALPEARSNLMEKLTFPGDVQDPSTSATILALARIWWGEYKTFEQGDTFQAAMIDGRMTVRQSPRVNVIPEISMKRLNSGRGDPTESKGGKFNTGVDGIQQRMNPQNFELQPEPVRSRMAKASMFESQAWHDRRGKYAFGLHDLSGSLLDPLRPTLTEQLNSDDGKLNNYDEVFMPVASEEDHQAYSTLADHAKKFREHVARRGSQPPDEHTQLYGFMVMVRRSMTRIKLAEDKDMHCGFIDIRPIGSTVPKYRYGLGAMTDRRRPTPDIPIARKESALHYKSITALARNAGQGYNEIIIAYREHRSPLFPIIARWDGRIFTVLSEGGITPAVAKSIPNNWAAFAG